MKVVVTGATGFIGGALARRLVREGHQVIALVRQPARAASLAADGVVLAAGDITDAASLPAAFEGADRLFHVAGWYKVGDPDRAEALRVNVDGTRNVLEAMRAAGIPKAVYTSSLVVNGDTRGAAVTENYQSVGAPFLSLYDESKWRAHVEVAEPLMAAGLPLVIVQPGLVYGPGDAGPAMETWRQYLLGKLRVIPARTAYAWTYIDDLVEGHIAAMDHGLPGTAYLMGGPNHTLAEAMAIAGRLTGIRAPKAVHPGLLAAGGAVADLAGRAGIGPGGELLRVLAGTTYIGDPARARRELGWNPRSLEAGLRTTLPPLAAQLGVTLPAFPEAA